MNYRLGRINSCLGQLAVPRFRLTTYGGQSFVWAAASVWNSLPDSLKVKDTTRTHYLVFRITQDISLLSLLTHPVRR